MVPYRHLLLAGLATQQQAGLATQQQAGLATQQQAGLANPPVEGYYPCDLPSGLFLS